ncbi:MAG: pyridoxal phosphate-dependent aminotransferase [Candidatus Fimisoma sp.]
MYYINENVKNLNRIFDQNSREGYLRLDLNENPIGLPQEFIDEVLSGVTPEFVAKYPETLEFTEKLAEFLGVEIENLCLTNGSAEGIRHVIEAYSRPGGKMLCVAPSYAMYEVYAAMYGREFVPVAYEGTNVNVDTLISKITKDIDLLIILNPNNPMGDVYTYDDMDRILAKAKENEVTILIDEAYFYFYKNSFKDYALQNNNVFLTRTFSKLFSLGSGRLGYVLGQPEGIAMVQKLCTPHNVNAFGMRFAQAILEKEGMVDWLVEKQLDGKNYVVDKLTENGYIVNAKEGNFIFVKTKTDAETVKRRLKDEKKILVKTYAGISDMGTCLRVSTGERQAMEQFLNALFEVDR